MPRSRAGGSTLPGDTAMTNPTAATTSLPALFRAGDIGVSSEWRDISYDWPPLLTAAGVSIYSYLRDTYDHQRSLRPFILNPDGPTKTRIQQMLGYRTSWAIQGPEYLLSTVGLLHVEVGYGPSLDPERPKRTRVAYYVVGRLDHPVLDWSMLDRVLDALMPALDNAPGEHGAAERQRKAQAALRSLAQAGMLQDTDPDDLLYPYGAWPTLLPTLIDDARWIALFTQIHGVRRRCALPQARPRLGRVRAACGSSVDGGKPRDRRSSAGRTAPRATRWRFAARYRAGAVTFSSERPARRVSAYSDTSCWSDSHSFQRHGLACESPSCWSDSTAAATDRQQPHANAGNRAAAGTADLSLQRDQLINRSRRGTQDLPRSTPPQLGAARRYDSRGQHEQRAAR